MKLSHPFPLALALAVAVPACSAGFLDRFKQASNVQAPAPLPPAEPSPANAQDAFGGSYATPEPANAAGTPSIAGKPQGQAAQTAVPVWQEDPYDGLEYRWRAIRIRPAELKLEGIMALGVSLYVIIALLGKRSNEAQAIRWWKNQIDILNNNFASFLKKPTSASLTRLDASSYVGHASGRRGTTGVAVRVKRFPRHDLFSAAFELGMKLYDLTWVSPTASHVELTFELPATRAGNGKEEDFFFAIVNKNQMMQVKSERWDLSLFSSSIVERPNDIGSNFVLFTETGQLSDFFIKTTATSGIKELFGSDNKQAKNAIKYLNYIIISDLVSERPEESALEKAGAIPKSRSLTMSLRLPSSGKEAHTRPLIEIALNLLDVIDKGGVPNETLNKAKKRRAEVYALLLQESRKEAKDKKTKEAQGLKKKLEDERKEKLSVAERRKLESKEREKALKKEAMRQQKR